MLHLFTFNNRWFAGKRGDKTEATIFFDGVCGLCNGFVNFILEQDRNQVYLFSPLQGETAAKVLDVDVDSTPESIVLVEGARTYTSSDAALRIIAGLGGLWTIARIFLLFPRFIRDCVYRFIAARRYRWFGKHEVCRVPTEEEKARFLP